jgi:hypothetical protein
MNELDLEENIEKRKDEDLPQKIYGLNQNKLPDIRLMEKLLSRRSAINNHTYEFLKNNCRSTRNRCFLKSKFFLTI